jgi:predicted SAM-dependent methyltransferase
LRPNGWINTDSSLNANIQKIPLLGKSISKLINPIEYDNSNMIYMNLNKKWKYKNETVDIVYASHLFEHLSLQSTKLFLEEAFRTLKPGGIIRIVVPDLYKIAKKYINEYENEDTLDPTEYIMWAINMNREGQYGDVSFLKGILLELQGYPHQHKYMYDEKSLKHRLQKFGFVDIESLVYGNSKYIESITDVEGKSESYLSIYIEAKKPNL